MKINTSQAATSAAPQQDTLEIGRHSKRDANTGKYKISNPFHRKKHHHTCSKAPEKGEGAPQKVECTPPQTIIHFAGDMHIHCHVKPGQPVAMDPLVVHYPSETHTIPVDYYLGAREHQVTLPDVILKGGPKLQVQPIFHFQPETVSIYPGTVVDKRHKLKVDRLDCIEGEDQSSSSSEKVPPQKGPPALSSTSSSSSNSAVAPPAKEPPPVKDPGPVLEPAPVKNPVAEQGPVKEPPAKAPDPVSTSSDEGGPEQVPVQQDGAPTQQVAPFAPKHWRIFEA